MVAGAAAALTGGAGVAAVVGAAVLPGVVEMLGALLTDLRERRLDEWLTRVAAEPRFAELFDAPGESAAILAKRMATEIPLQELILRVVRELDAAVSAAAVAPLAMLTREYFRSGRAEAGADDFFRGAAATFASFDGEQLGLLRTLVSAVAARPEEVPEVQIRGGELYFKTEEDDAKGHRAEEAKPNAWRRVFHRLKVEGLGFDNPAGFFDVTSGPDVLRMDRATAQRLLGLLAAASP